MQSPERVREKEQTRLARRFLDSYKLVRSAGGACVHTRAGANFRPDREHTPAPRVVGSTSPSTVFPLIQTSAL